MGFNSGFKGLSILPINFLLLHLHSLVYLCTKKKNIKHKHGPRRIYLCVQIFAINERNIYFLQFSTKRHKKRPDISDFSVCVFLCVFFCVCFSVCFSVCVFLCVFFCVCFSVCVFFNYDVLDKTFLCSLDYTGGKSFR